jgi:hypothetical protein
MSNNFDYLGELDELKQNAKQTINILNENKWEGKLGEPLHQQYNGTMPMPYILQYIGNIIALQRIPTKDLMIFSSDFSYHYKRREYLNNCLVVRVLPGQSVVSQKIPDTGDIVVIVTLGGGSVTIFNYKNETQHLYIPANSVYALRESAMYHTEIHIPGKMEDDVEDDGIINRETQYILIFSHNYIQVET